MSASISRKRVHNYSFIQGALNFGDDALTPNAGAVDPRWIREEFGGEKKTRVDQPHTATAKSQNTNTTPIHKKTVRYAIGDVLVYPLHGIVRVVDIKDEDFGGQITTCYYLKVDIKTSCEKPVIKLPVNKVESNKVTRIINRGQANEILGILAAPGEYADKPDKRTWNKRCLALQAKLRGGDIKETAEAFRDLVMLKQVKPLSHTEHRMYVQAEALVVKSLAIALDVDEDEMRERVIRIITHKTIATRKEM